MGEAIEQHEAPPGSAACPVCGSGSSLYCEKVAYGSVWAINRCRSCGHGFVVNRPNLETLDRIYSSDSSHHPTGGGPPPAPRKLRLIERLVRLSGERGDSLDVGSGNGEFSFQLARHGYRPVLIDVDARAQAMARHVPNAEFHVALFENFTYPRRFSAIVMSQVLEHALDPLAWLRHARELLSDKGVLAVALPNFGGLYRLLGRRDPMLIPPLHLNYFTPRSLRLAFEAAGLTPLAFDSSSRVVTERRDRAFSLKRRVVGRAANAVGWVFDRTPRGIMLHGYAGR